jgi:hypothetical protein
VPAGDGAVDRVGQDGVLLLVEDVVGHADADAPEQLALLVGRSRRPGDGALGLPR